MEVARSPLVAVLALTVLAVPSHAEAPVASTARVKQGVKAEIERGTLTITGNRKSNKVTLRLKRRARGTLEVDVKSNGSADFRFKRRAFKRIVVRGGRGNDVLGISERNGRFVGSERTSIDGGRGGDRLVFAGSRAADSIALSANRRRLRVAPRARAATTAANFALAARSLRRVTVDPLGGADAISVGDLNGTGVFEAALELGSASGGDGAADVVSANGTGAPDALTVGGGGPALTVGGLGAVVTASNLEPGQDRFTVNGLGGADTLHLSGTGAADNIQVQTIGGLLHAELGGTAIDSADIESLRVDPLGGADAVTLRDLGGSEVGQVAVDLGSTSAGPADGQTDSVAMDARDGADSVVVSGNSAAVAVGGLTIPTSVTTTDPGDRLTVNGLGGTDTINSSGLAADAGLLTLRGGPDADTLTGGPGDDTFAWDPGDGSDVVQGGGGTDNVAMGGSDVAENFTVAPAALPGHVQLIRNIETVSLDLDDVEAANLAPGAGADTVNVADLTGAELTQVGVNLGGADGQTDNVAVTGTNNPEAITVTPTVTGASVGLPATTSVSSAEPGKDTLTILALAGNDTVNASAIPAGVVDFVIQGGLGEDIFVGSQGSDLVQGGDGNDLALLGAGNDTFVWNPGDDNDTIEGQAGSDRMLFNGAAIAETIDIFPNGGRVIFFRNIANVTMDLNDVEIVDFNALGGADLITVNNTAGTDLTQVNLAFAAVGGVGDGQPDSVTLSGTNGNDLVTIGGGPAGVTATGLMPTLAITGAEAANDRLTVNGFAGDDTINASGVTTGSVLLMLNGDANNDTLIGGDGNDTITGGLGDDFLKGGPGTDTLDGGGQPGDVVIPD
ncbi:MAG TPA: calcium-binding protein [Thermoleophilaceae bacterium]